MIKIRKKNTWPLLALLLLMGCSGERDNEELGVNTIKANRADFPAKVMLEGEEIIQDDYHHHHKVYILDTVLLTTSNAGDYHFHAYHTQTQEYLGSMGVRGEGPDEWTMPSTTTGQHEVTEEGLFLWFFDYQRGHLSKIDLTKTLQSGSPYPILATSFRIDGRKFPYFQLFYLSDEKLVGDCWITEQDRVRIKSYNPKTEEVKKSPLFPSMKNLHLLPAEVINSLYSSPFVKHPTKNLFVQAMFVMNRIDIFDEDLNLLKSVVDGENWQDDYYDAKDINPASAYLKERIDGYDGLAATRDFIFALEMKKASGNAANRPESFVRVYDWEGRPVCLLQFGNNFNAIAVDEAEGMFYATDYANEMVLRYDIKNLMDGWKN